MDDNIVSISASRAERLEAERQAELAKLAELKKVQARRRHAEYRVKHRKHKAWKPTMREAHNIKIMLSAGLTNQQIAGVIGVSPATLALRCKELLATGADLANAKVASKLFQKCMKGDTIALLFWTKTRMGWSEKQKVEHTGADGGPIVYEQVEAEAAAFTSRIAEMAGRFAGDGTAAPPANDGELTQKSIEPAEAKQGA